MFGDLLSPVHIVVLLGIALLVFGPKRLPEIGAGLGKSIREFKQSMHGASHDTPQDLTVGTEYPAPVEASKEPRD